MTGMYADAYPVNLERWWIARVCQELEDVHPARAIAKLEPFTSRLSDLFTTDRATGFAAYADDPRALLAYGLFFFPQTFTRMRCILRECTAGGRALAAAGPGPLRVLDLGAGLGAASLALASLTGRPPANARPISLLAVDRSEASLTVMRELFGSLRPALWPAAELTTAVGTLLALPPAAAGPWDVILCSFALNEALEGGPAGAAEEWLQHTIDHLAPGGTLVLCEPALRQTAERIERLRDSAAASGRFRILGPCLHQAPCPLRQKGEAWCHEVRRWKAPPSLHFLNRHLFRSVQFLKFSFLALSREAPPAAEADSARARLVAPMNAQKGRFTTWGCAADGQIHPYEVQTRGLSSAAKKELAETERGSRLRWPDVRVLGDGATLRAAAAPVAEE